MPPAFAKCNSGSSGGTNDLVAMEFIPS